MLGRIGLTFALALAGCATIEKPPPIPPPEVSEERVIDRSYEIGKEQTAFVGNAMARVKDYRVIKTTKRGSLYASTDFTLRYPILIAPGTGPTVRVRATDPIELFGTTQRDGIEYRLVRLPNAPRVALLVTADGHFEGSGLSPIGNDRMGVTYSPVPADVILRPDTATSVVSENGYLNFELVYSGATKDSIRLLYREYTQRDLVRPAFTQDLVYERDAPTIRFRSMLIRLIQTTGEQIRFIVLEDGYPAK